MSGVFRMPAATSIRSTAFVAKASADFVVESKGASGEGAEWYEDKEDDARVTTRSKKTHISNFAFAKLRKSSKGGRSREDRVPWQNFARRVVDKALAPAFPL